MTSEFEERGDGSIPIGPADPEKVRALVDRYGLAGPIERLNAAVATGTHGR